MIFLCDYYNQASKDLAYSLQAAGYDATTVVINPDGFLPQGALSPFTYYVEAVEEIGKYSVSPSITAINIACNVSI